MILNPKESTIAYRCPVCGTTTVSVVGVFALSGDHIKLKCACSGSELTITYTPERKIRISVPCIICSKPHNFLISENTFFEKDVFNLSCAYTGLDICFIGKKDDVLKAAKEADEILLEMLKKAGLDSLDRLHEENTPAEDDDNSTFAESDIQMFEIVNFLIKELEDEKKITCRCKDGKGASYQFRLVGRDHDSVMIFCDNCGASKTFLINDPIAANAFLHIDEISLQ